jgi:hypothetical protein
MFIPQTQPDGNNWRLLIMDGHGSHVSIDFLWLCKQHKIQLLFLPAHSSHVLQPLDLGVFAPLKSKYRSQIAALASLDDAAPVKKQRFISCYHLARLETFTPRVLKAGWIATGIHPFNPQKGLNSSQIQAPKSRLATPPPIQQPFLFNTPKSSQHIYHAIETIRRQGHQDQARQTSIFQALRKAGQRIDYLNTRQAALEAQAAQLQAQVEALTTKRRRKVPVNPNTKFTNIDNIKRAQEAQALVEAREAIQRPVFNAARVSRDTEIQSFKALQFEWQLDSY